MSERYHYNFAWESPYGRVVRLLDGRVAGGSLVLDLGCGFGPLAEALQELGVTYVGCDIDEKGLASLRDRGFETHQFDLTDQSTVSERILKVVAGREVGAILLLDTLEHLPETDGFLAQLREVAIQLDRPLLGLSIPNVAHFDVGAKLLLGRWDVTSAGLLDSTHLQFFTEDRLLGVLAQAGWFEIARNDFRLHHSDQHFPADSPILSDGAPLRELLWRLRERIGKDATINQFVRLYGLSAPVFATTASPPARPFLSVLMRTQGRRMGNLLEAMTCLAAQTDQEFELLLLVHSISQEITQTVRDLVDRFAPDFAIRIRVHQITEGGRSHPLNVGLDEASGRYVAFLDDDDLVTADWVQRFREGAEAAPGRIVRSITADRRVTPPGDDQVRAPYLAVGPLEMTHAPEFDALEHLYQNRTPICSFAVPLDAVSGTGARFNEERSVLEDWEFLLTLSSVCGVHDTGRVTSVYHRWEGAESSLSSVGAAVWHTTRRAVLERLDTGPLLLPAGSASRIAALWESALALQERQGEIDRIRGQLKDRDDQLEHLTEEVQSFRARESDRAEIDRVRQVEMTALEQQARGAAAAAAEVEALRNSTSWRITYPLRRAVTLLRRRSAQ